MEKETKKEKTASKKPPSRIGHLITIALNATYKKKWFLLKSETRLQNSELLKKLIDKSRRKWD